MLAKCEREAFRCPPSCFGHIVNIEVTKEVLDAEEVVKVYFERKGKERPVDAAHDFLFSFLDEVDTIRRSPRELHRFFSLPSFADLERPYE